MATYTIAQAQEMFNEYVKAEKAILSGQSYTIKDRTLTRANLATVAAERQKWAEILSSLLRGGIRVRRGLPRDL